MAVLSPDIAARMMPLRPCESTDGSVNGGCGGGNGDGGGGGDGGGRGGGGRGSGGDGGGDGGGGRGGGGRGGGGGDGGDGGGYSTTSSRCISVDATTSSPYADKPSSSVAGSAVVSAVRKPAAGDVAATSSTAVRLVSTGSKSTVKSTITPPPAAVGVCSSERVVSQVRRRVRIVCWMRAAVEEASTTVMELTVTFSVETPAAADTVSAKVLSKSATN
jgi:hypothetical protein